MITDFALPAFTSASRRLASRCRNRASSWSCQSVCSMALRRLSMELIDRPGLSVPCSWVLASGCSWTSRVLRLRNLVSPTFSSTSAFLPSQTTTQSPCRTSTLDMHILLDRTLRHAQHRDATRLSHLDKGQTPEAALQLRSSSSRRAITSAWISAAPSKIDMMRASQSNRDTGNSSAKPLPPWICTALSAAAQATRAVQIHGGNGFEVAALAGILLPRREICELPRQHDFGRHHGELVSNAREIDDRLAELPALAGITQRLVERRLRQANRARGGLDARRFERRHQLPEALPLDAAEEAHGRDLEAVEGDLVFLHAAITEHLDLAA